MEDKKRFCKDCDKALGPWQKTRCDSCWLIQRKKWRHEEKGMDFYFWNRNFTKPNSQERCHKNAAYIKGSESLEHALEKAKVIWEHIQEGHTCISEAQRGDGVIHDVLCNVCGPIEIVKTSLSKKLKDGEVEVRKI